MPVSSKHYNTSIKQHISCLMRAIRICETQSTLITIQKQHVQLNTAQQLVHEHEHENGVKIKFAENYDGKINWSTFDFNWKQTKTKIMNFISLLIKQSTSRLITYIQVQKGAERAAQQRTLCSFCVRVQLINTSIVNVVIFCHFNCLVEHNCHFHRHRRCHSWNLSVMHVSVNNSRWNFGEWYKNRLEKQQIQSRQKLRREIRQIYKISSTLKDLLIVSISDGQFR